MQGTHVLLDQRERVVSSGVLVMAAKIG